MAPRQKNDLEREIDALTEGWVAINRQEDPMEWEAWTRWRRENLNTVTAPDNITVPTEFPPATINAANQYVDVIKKIRICNGWKSGNKRIEPVISAWMGR